MAGLQAVEDKGREIVQASRFISRLNKMRITPNALTATGVVLCSIAAVLVFFEYHGVFLFYWAGALAFALGSACDAGDGALARHGGKTTPFGGFLDSIADRPSEGVVLGAIALVFAREGNTIGLACTIAAVIGSFLVSYTRAKAEAIKLKGDVGFGDRLVRVIILTTGLAVAPWGLLQWAIYGLAAIAWITVIQRVLSVRKQLRAKD